MREDPEMEVRPEMKPVYSFQARVRTALLKQETAVSLLSGSNYSCFPLDA